MAGKDVFEVLSTIIREQCSYEGEIDKDTEIAVLNLNSFDYIKLIVAVEDAFEFEFEDEYLVPDKFRTINDVCNYIQDEKNDGNA